MLSQTGGLRRTLPTGHLGCLDWRQSSYENRESPYGQSLFRTENETATPIQARHPLMHRGVHDALLGRFARGELFDDATLARHQDAVGEVHNLGQVRGDHHNRQAFIG
jgi:hypothetical protein